jgi:hypothetical protein
MTERISAVLIIGERSIRPDIYYEKIGGPVSRPLTYYRKNR